MNRDVIGSFLCAAGHVVVLAESGQEAVRLASEAMFDLVLMDVRMPEMDGLEATRRIRALPAPRGGVPILALTAYTFSEQIAQFRDAGMDGHIAKPVDYATLVDAISTTIARTTPCWPEDHLIVPDVEADGDGQSPPRLDRVLLEQTLRFLPHDEVTANLQQLRARSEQMVRLLSNSTAPSVLTDTAHALASAVGMFGLGALSVAARSFECAVANGGSDIERLARQLQMEADAAIETLDVLLCESRTQSA